MYVPTENQIAGRVNKGRTIAKDRFILPARMQSGLKDAQTAAGTGARKTSPTSFHFHCCTLSVHMYIEMRSLFFSFPFLSNPSLSLHIIYTKYQTRSKTIQPGTEHTHVCPLGPSLNQRRPERAQGFCGRKDSTAQVAVGVLKK